MSKIRYEVVRHDGGWAYRVDGSFSETFASHDDAVVAAKRSAAEQQVAGEMRGIVYQDKDGVIHEDVERGDDRPFASVIDAQDETGQRGTQK